MVITITNKQNYHTTGKKKIQQPQANKVMKNKETKLAELKEQRFFFKQTNNKKKIIVNHQYSDFEYHHFHYYHRDHHQQAAYQIYLIIEVYSNHLRPGLFV